MIAVAEPAAERNFPDAEMGSFQQFACFLDSDFMQITVWRHSERFLEMAEQAAIRHVRKAGEFFQIERFLIVFVEVFRGGADEPETLFFRFLR